MWYAFQSLLACLYKKVKEWIIKNHPTWEGQPLNFEKRKPELNVIEIIEKINNEKKMDAKIDSIILNQSKH